MQNDNKDHYGEKTHNQEKLNNTGNKEPMNNDKPYSTGSLDKKTGNNEGEDEPKSKTYNEDEATWKKEREDNTGPNAEPSLNAGTKNNNWDANDPTQRTNGLHGDK